MIIERSLYLDLCISKIKYQEGSSAFTEHGLSIDLPKQNNLT